MNKLWQLIWKKSNPLNLMSGGTMRQNHSGWGLVTGIHVLWFLWRDLGGNTNLLHFIKNVQKGFLRPERSEGLPFLRLAIPGGICATPVFCTKVVQDFGILGWNLAGLVLGHSRRDPIAGFEIWPPEGQVYLVTRTLNWPFWPFRGVKWQK